MVNLDESFVEKYRPNKFNEFVNADTETVQKMLQNPKSMPHLLLVSRIPGTGKTSLAKLIIKELGADSLQINSSKDRTLDVIREQITKFSGNMSSKKDIPRIIILDEVDGMRKESQEALRGVMEDFSANCKFILTGNNIHKIIDAVKSRCTAVNFRTLPKEKIKQRLSEIIKLENIPISDEDKVLDKLLELYYPSMRDMIKNIQLAYIKHGKLDINSFEEDIQFETEVWELIKQCKFIETRKKVIESGCDIEDLFISLFNIMLKDNTVENKKNITVKFAEYSYKIAVGADSEISFAGFIVELEKWFSTN